jgi:DNA repair protein RadC
MENGKNGREKTGDTGHVTMKQMLQGEQPREKLERYGAESLSDAELLAILLRTGTKKLNVLEVSRTLVREFNGLRNLSGTEWQELRSVPGIGKVKAITLQAVFELSRRVEQASLGHEVVMQTPEDVVAYFRPRLRDLPHEEFYVAFLNHSKKLKGVKKISSGGSRATIVEVSEIYRQAMLNQANSIIVAHNHPSGYAKESVADINLTRKISQTGHMTGIPLEDHIIIAGDEYVSFRRKNLI